MDDIRVESSDVVPHKKRAVVFALLFCTLFLSSIMGIYLIVATASKPPLNFPIDAVVTIAPGLSVDDIAKTLQSNNVITSSALFKLHVILANSAENLRAGKYRFSKLRFAVIPKP